MMRNRRRPPYDPFDSSNFDKTFKRAFTGALVLGLLWFLAIIGLAAAGICWLVSHA